MHTSSYKQSQKGLITRKNTQYMLNSVCWFLLIMKVQEEWCTLLCVVTLLLLHRHDRGRDWTLAKALGEMSYTWQNAHLPISSIIHLRLSLSSFKVYLPLLAHNVRVRFSRTWLYSDPPNSRSSVSSCARGRRCTSHRQVFVHDVGMSAAVLRATTPEVRLRAHLAH